MEKHLNSKQYYIDLYDEITVNICRDIEKRYEESQGEATGDKVEEKKRINYAFYYFMLMDEAGERHLKKDETIRKWVDRDKEKDELLMSAQIPNNVLCLSCNSSLREDVRTLHGDNDGSQKVLFIMRCKAGCKKGRAFFEGGEEWIPKKRSCDKCGDIYREDNKKTKNKVTTYYTCDNCGNKDNDVLELGSKKVKIDKYYEKDRDRFCYNEKNIKEIMGFRQGMENMKRLNEQFENKEKNKDKYEKVNKLSKLTLDELEKKLSKFLESKKYSKLQLGEPEISNDVKVSFTIRDADKERGEYDSRHQLKKAIINLLVKTNWRLMSEGISYKLGILSGRLRGYDNEEDLLKLVK